MKSNALVGSQQIMDRTIGENIQAQINHHKSEIARLEGLAAKMREGASLLDIRIDDLRRVMQY